MRYAFILFCLYWNCVSAQLNGKYTFRHLDQVDGLLHTSVRGVGQDAQGFIWILTINGLQRYDGYRFINYPEVIGQSSFGNMNGGQLLVDTLNQQICVLKEDRMEKLDILHHKSSTLTFQQVISEDTAQKPGLYTDEHQDTWFIGEKGAVLYEKNTQKIQGYFFNQNPGDIHRHTMMIREPSSGNIWYPNYYRFNIADGKTKKIHSSSDEHPEYPFLVQLKKKYGNSGKLRYVMLDSDRNVWVSTWTNDLIRYNLDSKVMYTYLLSDTRKRQEGNQNDDITVLINAMYEDRQKNVWFATEYGGLLLYNREKDDFDFITSDEKISDGLRYNFSLYSIFQDREDNIWIGTDRGISIFNPYRNYFQSIHHIDGVESSLPRHDINDVIETDLGEILIATWGGGISVFDQQWNFIRNMRFPKVHEHNLLWSFVRNDDGNIWAGAQQGVIHIYDPVKQNLQTLQPEETEKSTILSMVVDQDGDILLGLHNGKIAIWKKGEKKFYAYNNADTPLSFPLTGVVSMYIDKANRCWVTTGKGLQEFDIPNRYFSHLYQPENISAGNEITMEGMEELNDSILVIGTIFHGMYFFNRNSGKFYQPFLNDQLNKSSVYAIKKDEDGFLWFTTDNSLYKMKGDLTELTLYNIEPSMLKATFNSTKFFPLKDGRWVTNTLAELICFDPGKITKKINDPIQVEISRFKVFDEPINIDSFLKSNLPIILPFNKNFISVEFSALDFTGLQQMNYYYRLADIDHNWIHSSTKQFADYTDLKPGEYVFEVRADNGSGPTGITSFPIIILSPWWGTLWFKVLSVLALGSLVYLIVKKRIQAIRKQSAMQHRIAETEMMALRSQMNPHFIFNCINGIDAMIQSNDKYRATMYLNKFAKLIRNVLDHSKENKVPLSKDMETLQLYIDLELFRHQNKFTASIHTEEELLQNDYKVPPLIIQPYVENAIIHGLRHKTDHDGKLSITVTRENEHIVYVIEDNGVGRKESNGNSNNHEHGFGMRMSDDRIRIFNDEEIASVQITDLKSNGNSSGTRIRVQLKM